MNECEENPLRRIESQFYENTVIKNSNASQHYRNILFSNFVSQLRKILVRSWANIQGD